MWESIEAKVRKPPFAGHVSLFGYVVDNKFPALYEGLGIPALEASASGVPVIASNVSSLPEVVGDAGVLIDPKDEEAWSQAMRELLEDESGRKKLREKGQA